MRAAHTSLSFRINGEICNLSIPPHRTLLEVLREDCALTGTKHGCELGECGACTVLLDSKPVLSCLLLALEVEGRSVDTIEGLARGNDLHPLQSAFADLGASQCGYCTSGMLIASKALLEENPVPTRDEIRRALGGNLCRCTGYQGIIAAVSQAARVLQEETLAEPTRRREAQASGSGHGP
jgi:carbon-monoxide dehydrogenase small subunit